MITHDSVWLQRADRSWYSFLRAGLQLVDPHYINQLNENPHWLPGPEKIFNAFSLPVNQINYVLMGESPYPRPTSANGFAFWDGAVKNLWTPAGLSKEVNRATSLRNLIKMLLIAEGLLAPHQTSQEAIANLNKESLIQTNQELFTQFLNHGFLLLNASLVLQEKTTVQQHAKKWQPFLKYILNRLFQERPQAQLILLGNIANLIDKLVDNPKAKRLYAEHPYNLSFITNPIVIDFFRPLHLLISDKPAKFR